MPVAKKKVKRITTAPSGTSFMYEPRKAPGPTKCVQSDCNGNIVQSSGTFPTATGQAIFVCTECDFVSPDGFEHVPTKRQELPKAKPIKKQHGVVDPPELRDAVRKEAGRRMKTLIRVRKEIGKPTLKLTDAERARLHKHGFSIVEIRDEIKEV